MRDTGLPYQLIGSGKRLWALLMTLSISGSGREANGELAGRVLVANDRVHSVVMSASHFFTLLLISKDNPFMQQQQPKGEACNV